MCRLINCPLIGGRVVRYNHRLPPTPIDRHWPCPPSKWQASTFSNATTAGKMPSSTMHSTRLVVPCTSATHLNGRVLMLHPWAETAERFRQQTTVLTRKLNQAGYDCIFLQAPHTLPSLSVDLASLFKDARVFWHERGHILSQSSALCAQVVDFLEECHVVKTRKT